MVAHRRNVGPGGLRDVAEGHAVLPASSEQVQRSIHKLGLRSLTGLATPIRFCLWHRELFNQTLKYTSSGCALEAAGDPIDDETAIVL